MVSVVAIIGGPIADHLGWQYASIILLPFNVAGAISVFFLVPETQFRRTQSESACNVNDISELTAQFRQVGHVNDQHYEIGKDDALQAPMISVSGLSTQRKSYVQSLAIYSGTYSDSSLVKLILIPFFTLSNPAVIWVSIRLPFFSGFTD